MKTIAPFVFCLLDLIPASITQDCKFIRYSLISFYAYHSKHYLFITL